MALRHSTLLLTLGRLFYVGGMILLFIGGIAGVGLANADMAVRMNEMLAPLMGLGSIAGDALGFAMNPSASSDKTVALSGLSAVGVSAGLCTAILGGRVWEHAVEKLPQGRRMAGFMAENASLYWLSYPVHKVRIDDKQMKTRHLQPAYIRLAA